MDCSTAKCYGCDVIHTYPCPQGQLSISPPPRLPECGISLQITAIIYTLELHVIHSNVWNSGISHSSALWMVVGVAVYCDVFSALFSTRESLPLGRVISFISHHVKGSYCHYYMAIHCHLVNGLLTKHWSCCSGNMGNSLTTKNPQLATLRPTLLSCCVVNYVAEAICRAASLFE